MERTSHLTSLALRDDYDSLGIPVTEATLEIAYNFFNSGHQVPGGGAITQNPRMVRGFSGAYPDEAMENAYMVVAQAMMSRKMALSMYGCAFVVGATDPEQASIHLSAAGELCRRLAYPYLHFDANHLATMIRANDKLKLNIGVGATIDLSPSAAMEHAGILHLVGSPDMNSFTQSICNGMISTMLNRGLFVILEGDYFTYTNRTSMHEYIIQMSDILDANYQSKMPDPDFDEDDDEEEYLG